MLHILSLLPQQNLPSKKKKQAVEDDDFHFEVGSPAEHFKPPACSQAATNNPVACSQAATTNDPVGKDSEPPGAAAQDSEPSTSIVKNSEPPCKTVEDHADFLSDSSDSDIDPNLWSSVDDALSNASTVHSVTVKMTNATHVYI